VLSGHPLEFTPAKAEAGVTKVAIGLIPNACGGVVHLFLDEAMGVWGFFVFCFERDLHGLFL
jgi:hypothetical protein